MKSIFILFVTLSVFLNFAPFVKSQIDTFTNGNYTIEFIDYNYDYVSDKTTFSYNVTTTDIPSLESLSHWVLQWDLKCITQNVTGGPGTTEITLDPITNLYGFKWDEGQEKGETKTYNITMPGVIMINEDSLELKIKAGTEVISGQIQGPDCFDVLIPTPTISPTVTPVPTPTITPPINNTPTPTVTSVPTPTITSSFDSFSSITTTESTEFSTTSSEGLFAGKNKGKAIGITDGGGGAIGLAALAGLGALLFLLRRGGAAPDVDGLEIADIATEFSQENGAFKNTFSNENKLNV